MRHIQYLAHLAAKLKPIYFQPGTLLFYQPHIGPQFIKLLPLYCPESQRFALLQRKICRCFRRKFLPDPAILQQHITVSDSLQIPQPML